MPQAAYELENFAPKVRAARPRVRVAPPRGRSARGAQRVKMLRTLLAVAVPVLLVAGVLQTQAATAELQSRITSKQKLLSEEQGLYAYLSFQMENMSSLKSIEEAAVAMGYEKMSSGQIYYFRAEDQNSIETRQDPLEQLADNARDSLLSVWETLNGG